MNMIQLKGVPDRRLNGSITSDSVPRGNNFPGFMVTFSLAGFACLLAIVLLSSDADVYGAVGLIISCAGLILTIHRLDWGIYILLGAVLFFDQFQIPGFGPFTYKFYYFENFKASYFPSLDAAVMNPLELHLIVLLLTWLVRVALRRQRVFVRIPVWPAGVLLLGWILFSFANGMRSGGDFLPALWEVRAFFYFAVCYFVVPQIIRERQQIRNLMWVAIGVTAFKALQGIERFIQLGFTFQGLPTLTSHEDAAFFVILFVFLLAMMALRAQERQRAALLWLLIPLLIGFVVAQRRASFGSFAVSVIALWILLPSKARSRLVRTLLIPVIITAIYLSLFWENTSALGQPAQLVKASFTTDREEAGEKYYSNLYRVVERYNIAVTSQQAPLLGIGFGKRYETPVKLARISFPLWDYIPHNQIFWVLVKMGGIGFLLFWLFFNSFVLRSAAACNKVADPYLKSVAAVCAIAVINQVFISYFDLQLTYHRNMVYLGVLMGLLPTIESISKQEEESDAEAGRYQWIQRPTLESLSDGRDQDLHSRHNFSSASV